MSDGKALLMKDASLLALVAVIALAAPSSADVIGPLCDAPGPVPLSVGGLVDLVLSTLVGKGIAVLFMGAIAIVGLPWLIAASAVGLLHLPERLRERA
jgi:hypothetical protein